ncbi:Uncharacterized protein APZ42_032478 [Daphnia magna]|uniref:Uncharacterized protein n=1 Tax=Daphnia magna TaxID=35525 RepID=A0A164LLB7_9CRUS|nr:Uncharacterized protein APZ42_032478 [Daphnia magna]
MLVFSQLLWFPMFSRLSPQFNIKLLVLFVGRANKCQSQVELEPLSFGCVQRDDRIKSYMACPDKELTFDFSCLVSNVADNRYRGANVISMLSNQDIATLLLVGRSSVICLILHMNDKTRIMPAAHNRTCCVNISLASRTGQLSRKYRDERQVIG